MTDYEAVMCKRKDRYESQGHALAMAVRAARRQRIMRVYRCPYCDGWHLTHKPALASVKNGDL